MIIHGFAGARVSLDSYTDKNGTWSSQIEFFSRGVEVSVTIFYGAGLRARVAEVLGQLPAHPTGDFWPRAATLDSVHGVSSLGIDWVSDNWLTLEIETERGQTRRFSLFLEDADVS